MGPGFLRSAAGTGLYLLDFLLSGITLALEGGLLLGDCENKLLADLFRLFDLLVSPELPALALLTVYWLLPRLLNDFYKFALLRPGVEL